MERWYWCRERERESGRKPPQNSRQFIQRDVADTNSCPPYVETESSAATLWKADRLFFFFFWHCAFKYNLVFPFSLRQTSCCKWEGEKGPWTFCLTWRQGGPDAGFSLSFPVKRPRLWVAAISPRGAAMECTFFSLSFTIGTTMRGLGSVVQTCHSCLMKPRTTALA